MVKDHSQNGRAGLHCDLAPKDDLLLALIPPGGPGDFMLVLGDSGPADPSFYAHLGYGHVTNSNAGHFDLERDFYPYPSAHFKTIVCCDVLETLAHDPIHMMDEIHRVLRPECHLVFATRRFTRDQVRGLLENCGLEVTLLESGEERVCAVARKVGVLRERFPGWLYPER